METTFVRCGNRQVHGTDKVSHNSVAEVRACFAETYQRPSSDLMDMPTVGDNVSFILFGYTCNGSVETVYPDGWLRVKIVGEDIINIHSGYVTMI